MNPEQTIAFEAVKARQNVFITGPAGTGKSYLIDHIKAWAISKGLTLAVTALTGCAAVLIGGRTLHSTLGIGLAQGNVHDIVAKIYSNPTLCRKLRAMDILIIDELSMMSDDLFDKVSGVLSVVRESPAPFGGLQVVLCGDFCQLPPITGTYCFKSPLWETAIQKTVLLTRLMRQQDDEVFQTMLNELRMGVCGPDTFERLKALLLTEADSEADAVDSPIRPTILYSLRVDVDRVNQAEYRQVLVAGGGKERIYKTKYEGVKGGQAAKPQAKKWADSIGIPEAITLCVGAQVVVTANVDVENGIINGSRGIVTRLGDCPEIQLLDGRTLTIDLKRMVDDSNKLVVLYCPLQYAWALTINKSQGMTLDKAIIDLGSSVFASGQAYTALSRVRNLDSVRLMGLLKKSFRLSPAVAEFIGHLSTTEAS